MRKCQKPLFHTLQEYPRCRQTWDSWLWKWINSNKTLCTKEPATLPSPQDLSLWIKFWKLEAQESDWDVDLQDNTPCQLFSLFKFKTTKFQRIFFSGFPLHRVSLKVMQTTLITTASHIRLCDNKKPQGHSITLSKTRVLLFYSRRSSRF